MTAPDECPAAPQSDAGTDETALMLALQRVDAFSAESGLATWLEIGWTAASVETVEQAARSAITQRTNLARTATGSVRDLPTVWWLLSNTWTLTVGTPPVGQGLPEVEMMPWLSLQAMTQDPAEAGTVHRLLVSGHPAHPWESLRPVFGAWRALGPFGPLAFAAGLTLTEALDRHAAKTLDAVSLHTLAALRGYRLPLL